MNEPILEKIKKLLSLSKSQNQFEADLALEKASQFATEHGIDLAFVAATDSDYEEKVEVVQETVNVGQRMPTLQKYASWIIGNHFDVQIVYSGGRYGKGREIFFIGDKKDVEFAIYLNGFIQEDMARRWNYYKRSNNTPAAYKQTWCYNCYKGLSDKLHQNKRDTVKRKFDQMPDSLRASVENKYSLILTDKKSKVDEFMRKAFSSLRSTKTRVNNMGGDVGSDGYSTGQTMTLNRPLGSGLRLTN